ncbi:hypothetical protein M406DRAFT_266940 [Cryphonectria parasitica EP155]|uniref:Amino acid transporter transmembrane domain-containing protein n=1 Tax=Cryphonectria parasitica (strain ATCC 38755 / EP155) TaxID=660469 RepID=A0A9P4XVB0_CRYP1|nr:uncharacterized protein M406DRAFT_266940 [Cryphonectria parasitica EP155]KAF3761947.1 hypothetical protein M406DRAFT_266940 [Cryphonectria parasitica EP155]
MPSLRQLQIGITFEEYKHHASITRANEKKANEEHMRTRGPVTLVSLIKDRFSKGHVQATRQDDGIVDLIASSQVAKPQQKDQSIIQTRPISGHGDGGASTSDELYLANRALRTAGWGSVFYLITTDVLGPSNTPWAFAQTGYGPGVVMYIAFGSLSAYSGWLLYKMFLGLDSDRYPLRNYADIFLRLYGSGAGYFVHFAQAVQLILSIAYLILLNGQAISQISQTTPGKNGLCFIVCVLIFTLIGMVAGQVRTLQRFAWLANFSVFIQLIQVFIIMGLVAHFAPNYAAIEASFGLPPGPIQTFAGTPPDGLKTGGTGSSAGINAASQAVLAYGGAMFFPAFMAEMRHPMDFWKGMVCAQALLTIVYVVFGAEVYHFQGQFTYLPVAQGISNYGWQTALNVMSMLAGLIATCLYTNIGLKIAYVEVLQPFGFSPLTTKKGKLWWAAMAPVVWAIGFVIAPAIPQLASVSSFGGALFGIGFSYIFPALGALGYFIREDAMVADMETFDEASRTYNYVDRGWKRFLRAVKKRPLFHLWNLVYFLCSLGGCVLGCYTAIKQIILIFQAGVATSFTCTSPV